MSELVIAMLPMAILLLTALSLLVIRLFLPGFRYYWLVMVVGAASAWVVQLWTGSLLPIVVKSIQWEPAVFLPIQLTWVFDQIAWSFSVTTITIWLASLLTGVVRIGRTSQSNLSPGKLASGAILTSFLLLAVARRSPDQPADHLGNCRSM